MNKVVHILFTTDLGKLLMKSEKVNLKWRIKYIIINFLSMYVHFGKNSRLKKGFPLRYIIIYINMYLFATFKIALLPFP